MRTSTAHQRSMFLGEIEKARLVGTFLISRNRYGPNLDLTGHTHHRPYISFVIRGSYIEVCGTRSYSFLPGTLVYHPGGEEHSDRFDSHGAVLLNIDIHDAACIFGRNDRLLESRSAMPGPQTLIALQICREFGAPCPISDLLIESLAFELLGNCDRRMRVWGTPRWLASSIAIANDHHAEHLSLAGVASEVGVHPVHLARHFRRRMGCTFGEFVRRIRLTRALEQLRCGRDSIAQIAARTGFADQSHLTRLMTAIMHVSPAAYRRNWQHNTAQ